MKYRIQLRNKVEGKKRKREKKRREREVPIEEHSNTYLQRKIASNIGE